MEEHKHTGLDQPQISPRDLLGFPIFASAPTHSAPEGTVVLFYDGANYKIYARINQTWKSAALT